VDSQAVVEIVQAVVKIAVPLVAFSVGLSSASSELKWLWKRPALLARSLIAVMVLVPAAAVVLVRTVELPSEVAAGLLVVAISVGPVAALKKSKARGGDHNYAVGLDVTLLLASLIYVPIAVAIIGGVFGRQLQIGVGEVARVILPLQLLPLIAGLALGRFAPNVAAKIDKPVAVVANVLLAAVALVVVVAMFKPMAAIGGRGLLALMALAITAVLIGELLGGPEEGARPVLASFAAMRFPALAISLASLTAVGPALVPVVVAYLLVSAVILAVYSVATRTQASAPHRRTPEVHP
jgi:BASS family bile acid:Na+ symporter